MPPSCTIHPIIRRQNLRASSIHLKIRHTTLDRIGVPRGVQAIDRVCSWHAWIPGGGLNWLKRSPRTHETVRARQGSRTRLEECPLFVSIINLSRAKSDHDDSRTRSGVPPFCVDNPIIKGKIGPYEGAILVIGEAFLVLRRPIPFFGGPAGLNPFPPTHLPQ